MFDKAFFKTYNDRMNTHKIWTDINLRMKGCDYMETGPSSIKHRYNTKNIITYCNIGNLLVSYL